MGTLSPAVRHPNEQTLPSSGWPGAARYQQLNPNAREIRIATLHAAWRSEDPIECSLETLPLNDPGLYEALSYTWGDASQRCDILVNGTGQSVTLSLQCALRHLRFQDSSRRIWVDSICIDQSNDTERQHQVQLMRHIYQGASRVVVWLGPEQDGSNTGIDFIRDLAVPPKIHRDYNVGCARIRSLPPKQRRG